MGFVKPLDYSDIHTPGAWASNASRFKAAWREERRDAKRASDGDWDALEAEKELYEQQMAAIEGRRRDDV